MPPWFLSLWYSDAAGGGLTGRPAWDEDKEMALECLGLHSLKIEGGLVDAR